MAKDSWKQSRNCLFFGEIQVGMANARGFHLHQNFVISEIVVDADLLVVE
jgi:hypothetical protein